MKKKYQQFKAITSWRLRSLRGIIFNVYHLNTLNEYPNVNLIVCNALFFLVLKGMIIFKIFRRTQIIFIKNYQDFNNYHYNDNDIYILSSDIFIRYYNFCQAVRQRKNLVFI